MTDTSPTAARLQAEIQRRLSGVDRLRIAFDMSVMARGLARARLVQEHPDWHDADVDRELLRAAFAPSELPAGLR